MKITRDLLLIQHDWKEKGISDIEGAKQYLKNYRHSSYLDYIGEDRAEKIILNKSAFPEYFEENKEFNEFIDDWLNYSDSYPQFDQG